MKKRSAFSLIELSIVVLIIGILISGVQQATKLVLKAKLKNARVLTTSSPVTSTKNLIAWYETSMESSFDDSDREDGATISTWYDNSKQNPQKNSATQSTDDYKPVFYENIFNYGIPAVRFDGSNDYLEFDGDLLVDSDYTIFVVEQKRASLTGVISFIGGTTTSSSKNLAFGYRGDNTIIITHYGVSTLYYTDSDLAYSKPTARIHSATFSSTNGMYYWLNGSLGNSSSSNTTSLASFNGAAIARRYDGNNRYFNGDIAEIIIFNRDLPEDEKEEIEQYLGKKYSISIDS